MRPGETLTASLRRSSAISLALRLFAKNGKERKRGFSMTAFAVQIGIKNRKERRKTDCSILLFFALMRRVARRPEALRRRGV